MAQFNTYLNRRVTTPVFTYENIPVDSLELSLMAVSDSMLANNQQIIYSNGSSGYERQGYGNAYGNRYSSNL